MKSTATFLLFYVVLLASSFARTDVDFSTLERIPVQDAGRKKPFATFARESLQGISGRSDFQPAGEREKWSAVAVIIDMWLRPERWLDQPVIFISYKPFKSSLGLDPARQYFSFNELV